MDKNKVDIQGYGILTRNKIHWCKMLVIGRYFGWYGSVLLVILNIDFKFHLCAVYVSMCLSITHVLKDRKHSGIIIPTIVSIVAVNFVIL